MGNCWLPSMIILTLKSLCFHFDSKHKRIFFTTGEVYVVIFSHLTLAFKHLRISTPWWAAGGGDTECALIHRPGSLSLSLWVALNKERMAPYWPSSEVLFIISAFLSCVLEIINRWEEMN